jgi:hypothetical protein
MPYQFTKDFVHVNHLTSQNYTGTGALHEDLAVDLCRRGIPVFYMPSDLAEGDFGWGTHEFHRSQRGKVKYRTTADIV